jgi:hypothetical protein
MSSSVLSSGLVCSRSVRARPARRAAVRCQAGAEPVSRRSVAAAVFALPALLAVRPALALLPDDDDEECAPRAARSGTPG